MSLYAWILVGTFLGPFALSFDKKVAFYKSWKPLFIAILLVGAVFILWDQYFTFKGVWGFNPRYNFGINIGYLPLEEWLFFIFAPYSCVFIHQCLKAYFPNLNLENFGKIFAFFFVLSGLILSMSNLGNWYTLTACSISSILLIGFVFRARVSWFGRFALTYCVAMIPFTIVNGLLTGVATSEPVVWYNEAHIVGFRITTIPIEDWFYNMCMLLPIVAIYEKLTANSEQKKTPKFL